MNLKLVTQQPSKQSENIRYEIFDRIILNTFDPAEVRRQVGDFLDTLPGTEENIAAVYYEARDLARVRHHEFEVRDGDMERVIASFDAVLDNMINWLVENGHDGEYVVRERIFDPIRNDGDAAPWQM